MECLPVNNNAVLDAAESETLTGKTQRYYTHVKEVDRPVHCGHPGTKELIGDPLSQLAVRLPWATPGLGIRRLGDRVGEQEIAWKLLSVSENEVRLHDRCHCVQILEGIVQQETVVRKIKNPSRIVKVNGILPLQ